MNSPSYFKYNCVFALSIICAASVSVAGQVESYTYPQLVNRMTDMQELAKLPPPGEKAALASSYDRSSKYDAATDKYINWSANGDGDGTIRQEGSEAVFAEFEGPGCIWRIWAATVGEGHVKIYLDGATEPAVDLPFKSYFDGSAPPFNRPNLVYVPSPAAHGYDNFTPITFQKSCKIVGEKGWGRYYQFNYTHFPAGTIVPTFRMNLSPEDAAALDEADKILGQSGESPMPSATTKTEKVLLTVPAGQSGTAADLIGPGAITALKVKLDLPTDPEAQRVLLRQLTISIKWDGEAAPAVWSPLGDFFAYVGGANKFTSLPNGLLNDGTFYSYWYMPFARTAHVEIGNDGPNPVSMTWEVSHAPLTQPIEKFGRFHAKWHRDAFLPERADREIDWTVLTTKGQGRFVGTHLHGWNPRGNWWGEGDDKFFVDGEKFPSFFGTGSEDYFGYAWSSAGHFSRPYHNQILNEGNAGHFDDNRWHIADSIPFHASFEGDIEKYYLNSRSTLYAAEAFWYLNAGGTDPYVSVPVADRIGYWVRPVIYIEPHVVEGESFRKTAIQKSAHNPFVQDTYLIGKTWSGDKQLCWRPTDIGENVELEGPAQKAGAYQLKAHFTNGPELGIFQMSFNGVDVGKPIDLYGPKMTTGDVIDLGPVTIPEGKPLLKVTLVGKNPSSTASNFGLDYIKLVPTVQLP